MDLLTLLRSRSLTFLVSKVEASVQVGKVAMPQPFRYPFDYPFSEARPFSMESFEEMIEQNKVGPPAS